jgi:hypothetical protein
VIRTDTLRTSQKTAWFFVVCLSAFTACAEHVVWHGHSPDRRRQVSVLESGGAQRLVVDGIESKPYRAIGVEAVTFSPDSRRLAFPAQTQDGWLVVTDGHHGPSWDGVGEIVFDPTAERLAYSAERARSWHVVSDGSVGPPFAALRKQSLTFSPDGRRLVYVGYGKRGLHVVSDGRVGRAYDAVGAVHFSPDGSKLGYAARRGRLAVAVLESIESETYDDIRELALGPGGHPFAYVACRNDACAVIVDGIEQPFRGRVAALRVAATSGRVAYIAESNNRAGVVVDGNIGKLWDRVNARSFAFSADGQHLGYIAARAGRRFVVVDAKPEPAFDAVWALTFARRGAHYAYAARRGKKFFVVHERRARGAYSWVGAPVLDWDGRHAAYLARRAERWFVVHDNRETPVDAAVEGTLVLSPRGTHWACLAGDRSRKSLFVLIDGVERRTFDTSEIVSAVLARRDSPPADASLLRRLVEAEMNRSVEK